MERQDQSMQEGATGDAVNKCADGGPGVEAFVGGPPGLQRAARHVKDRGGLTLGGAWLLPSAIPRKQLRAFATLPALGALILAMLLVWDDGSHSCPSFSSHGQDAKPWIRMARELAGGNPYEVEPWIV
jgi:hypothetical protein